MRRQVNNDRLATVSQRVNNVGTEFQHFLKHILSSTTETTPVREQEDGQIFGDRITDTLGRLEREGKAT